MRRWLNGIGQVKAERARDELLDRGFIRQKTKGSFSRKSRHATEYVLTNEPIDNGMGATAPKDFMRWRSQKNTVLMTSTVKAKTSMPMVRMTSTRISYHRRGAVIG